MGSWWERRLSQSPMKPPPPQQPRPQPPPNLPPIPEPREPVDLCPNCHSENYMAATTNTQKRCYDCGYPMLQSGTGVASGRTDGTTKKARQVQSGGYSPGVIIGRVQ